MRLAPWTIAQRGPPRVTAAARERTDPTGSSSAYQLEVVVPAYNEAPNLEASVTRLRRYLDESFPFRTLVTIVDNGSTDGTALIAQRLASTLKGVQALILARKGRGYALRTAWSASEADVVAYMDVDLSTSLSGLLPLVGSVLSGHSDLAVGTRLARGSRVVRGPKRELISRGYSHMVRLALRSRVSDFQCGFKAIRRQRALQILPLVDDDEWFFDTELIVTAERLGLRISETPVEWTDDPASSVDIVRTALDDLRGIWRMARRRERGATGTRMPTAADRPTQASADQLLSFAGVGVLSTLSYLLLFAAAWSPLGPWLANAVALAFCTLVNTALHRSLARRSPTDTAGIAGRPAFVTVVAVLYGVSLVATTGAIAFANVLAGPSLVGDAVAASLACCVAALVRFSLLRGWAFRPAPPPALPARATPRPDGDGAHRRPSVSPVGEQAGSRPHAILGVASGSTGARPDRSRTRCRPLLRPTAYYLLSRAAVFATALVATSFIPKLRIVQTMGSAFDGRWYLKIAQSGYPHRLYQEGQGSRWAFFPGFPAAVRALAEVTRLSLPDAAVLAAFVFGLTSALAIWLAVREVFGARLADRAVLLYVFCPTAPDPRRPR